MSAFNWIDYETVCPSCRRQATVRIQFHYGSSYDGDDCGSFHGRWYRIGDRIRWFKPSDFRFGQLALEGIQDDSDPGLVREYCYSRCKQCGAELFALLAYRDLTILAVLQLGLEKDIPDQYR